MQLFLVRHAHAVTVEENPARPLSPRGRADAARVASFLRAAQAGHAAQIWHSPLARAVETAQIFQATLNPDAALVETEDLLPEDDAEVLAQRLASYPSAHDLALVGHEPHLGELASLLVRGKRKPVIFALRKAAVIALERTNHFHRRSELPRWRVRWHFSPELLPIVPPAATPMAIEPMPQI
ncbi:MAG TPA: phosphohistidine phosphatase SixA [Candidatus Synoicihabitans sp.]|nr:phosphohistidine phosphatase SixA [Candidatus Synoicihabitans sp.]